ncbi:hypothetical protein Tco_0439342 [Tanacetum coccineum]
MHNPIFIKEDLLKNFRMLRALRSFFFRIFSSAVTASEAEALRCNAIRMFDAQVYRHFRSLWGRKRLRIDPFEGRRGCTQTRSSSKFVGEPSTNPKRHRRSKQRVEPFSLVETPVVTMVDQRIMAELLHAPTEGYAEAIAVPPIPFEHIELKHSLINLVTSKQFFSFEKEDPHAHIRYFNKITSTLKYKDVPETSIKLMLFLFSIDGPARIWLDKEPSRSILTLDDLVSKFINHFFPPSRTTNLLNEILNFQQYSLNSTAGSILLERSTQDVLRIIENKSKVRNSRNKLIVSQVKASNVDSSKIASAVASAVTSAMTAMFKQHQVTPALAFIKVVEESYVTCGGAHSF